MPIIIETLIFTALLAIGWYFILINNWLGMGRNVKTKKDALLGTLVFAVMAGIVFYLLSYVW